MKKIIILMFLLAAVIISAGCNEKTQASGSSLGDQGDSKVSTGSEGIVATAGTQNISVPSQGSKDASTVEEVTQLEQVNASLQNGPVLLKIGAEWCEPCQAMKPVLNDLAAEYAGKATIMSIDVDKSPKLVDYFGVGSIPDSSVIVGIENNEYVYMQEDGKVTKDRFQARILGLPSEDESKSKEKFENVLNLALQHENTKSA